MFLGARVDGRPGLHASFVVAGLLGLAIAYCMLGGGGGAEAARCALRRMGVLSVYPDRRI